MFLRNGWLYLLDVYKRQVYGLAMGHRHDLDYTKYSLMYKVFVGGLATRGKFIPMKAIFVMQKAIALKDKHSKGDLRYYSNYQPDYLYVTLHKDWCKEVIDAPFEDTTLMIPKGWDPVLKEVYGDYMQPVSYTHLYNTVKERNYTQEEIT